MKSVIKQVVRYYSHLMLGYIVCCKSFDIFIGELAFSVIPDWKKVMKTSASLLKENAKIGLLDWYREKHDWLTKIVDYLADAETNRNTIKYAEKIFSDFSVKDKFFFNNVYIGTGEKINEK